MKRRRGTGRAPTRFSCVRERKEGGKDEKTEGLGPRDAVGLKFMEASECRRERRMGRESEGERGRQRDGRRSGR